MIDTPEIWVSDCGRYFAVKAPCYQPAYDVVESDGRRVWLHKRYEPKGCGDTDRRNTYPEFARMVLGWSNRTQRLRGHDVYKFELVFADCNKRKKIKPFTGNTILANYSATFSRKVLFRRTFRLLVLAKVQEAIDA